MKAPVSQWILVAAACVVVASCVRAEAPPDRLPDRPPGVDESSWVPISDTAGIVVTTVTGNPVIRLRGAEAEAVVPQSIQRGTGILMVKLGGAWTRIDLQLPAARVQPLL
jgi:hypothetical protein